MLPGHVDPPAMWPGPILADSNPRESEMTVLSTRPHTYTALKALSDVTSAVHTYVGLEHHGIREAAYTDLRAELGWLHGVAFMATHVPDSTPMEHVVDYARERYVEAMRRLQRQIVTSCNPSDGFVSGSVL